LNTSICFDNPKNGYIACLNYIHNVVN